MRRLILEPSSFRRFHDGLVAASWGIVGVAILLGCGTEPEPPASEGPPPTRVEEVVDVLHGVEIVDPYRWLEDQESAETRA